VAGSKKKRWIWIGGGALLVLLLVGLSIARQSGSKATPVQLARVRTEDITSTVRAPGKIEPRTQVKISADIMGKIVQLAVQEGDQVKRGQLMLRLDDAQHRALHAQARAAVSTARARRNEADKALIVATSTFERQRKLFEQTLLSQAEWDQANSSYESARVGASAAAEEVARAEAALAAAQDNLGKTRFVAPIDGVVSALNVEEGEIVITGTMNNPGTQILVVSDLSRMLVRADVDETDVPDMRLGQKAKITVDALPDTSFPGTVTEIGSTAKRDGLVAAADGQTNFEIEVVFDQHVPAVRPGMTADVEIETATHARATGVPIQAVVVRSERELERAQKGKARERKPRRSDAIAAEDDTAGRKDKEITGLFVVRDGVATFVPVRTGIASESMIEVFGEMKPGESVVSGPYKSLRELKPGAKVKTEAPGGKGRGPR
jgi:HlyD family secretion protein